MMALQNKVQSILQKKLDEASFTIRKNEELQLSLTEKVSLPINISEQGSFKANKLVMAMQMRVRNMLLAKIEQLKEEHSSEIGKVYADLANQKMQQEAEKGALLEDQFNQEVEKQEQMEEAILNRSRS
jgi:hypothetical protein